MMFEWKKTNATNEKKNNLFKRFSKLKNNIQLNKYVQINEIL